MICIPIIGPSLEQAVDQIQKALPLANLIELRLDFFDSLNLNELSKLISSISLPVIFTLRSNRQGGRFTGDEYQRLRRIDQLCALKPAYLDLEFGVPLEFIKKIKSQYPSVQIILSYHNFEHTPPDLPGIIHQMNKTPADIIKIAAMVHSTLDSLRLLHLARKQSKNLITMGMGKLSPITRILVPIAGSKFTYASLSEANQTAPGQVPAKDLISIYGYKNLNMQTGVYGVIGSPVDKSMGPWVHNAVMQSQGLNAVYVKMEVGKEELKDLFPLLKEFNFKGLSVTMPLKEEAFAFLNDIDPSALKIGAVNTIAIRDGILHGTNTDGAGALQAIEQKIPVKNKKLILIGAGGAARAIAYEAVCRGARVIVLNRHREKAERLAQDIGCLGEPLENIRKHNLEGYDIIINCTPAAMPIDPEFILPRSVAMDIISVPKETPFLAKAKERECRLVYGYEMWLYQALGQLEYWFGESVDLVKAREAMLPRILGIIQASRT